MGVSKILHSMSCEVKIIEARNLELKSKGNLFVRIYLPTGDDKKVELNTKEVSRNQKLPIWNESFRLECRGAEASIEKLERKERIVFELRCRNRGSVVGKFRKSELLGTGDLNWGSVLDSPGMELEKLVSLVLLKNSVDFDDVKPPLLKVSVRVCARELVKEMKMMKKKKFEGSCGCEFERCNCVDLDAFVLAAAFDAL